MTVETRKFETIKVEKEDGITWLYFNRPEKRNAMSPTLTREMWEALDALDGDFETKVLVLTGAGDKSWSAGMDIREAFRERQGRQDRGEEKRRGAPPSWHDLLLNFSAPTIAMVNGYCFGGAFTPLYCCDIAIAAEDATFGVSEVNWGVIPGGLVSKVLADMMSYRKAMYYIMTGDPFDGKQAEEMGVVTKAVPRDKLKEETVKMAHVLMEKNPNVLRACREAFKAVVNMDHSQARAYLSAQSIALRYGDPSQGQAKGMSEFLDKKTYRPGFGTYRQD
ncbi:MAG: p-hydroxycinnamoyl CoA hydratase/lyase [Chloroflexi bacterium]|nr:p-hydroxycinnamoyl CoA hydratase/lyase [Chloroflexota bacterium]